MSSYTIPNVIASSPRGDRVMDVYSHLLAERIVYLGTEIDDGVSNALIAQILHLESTAPDQEINLYINSPGGSLTATFAVYDAMQFVRSPVATTCVGQACSTAAILLTAPFMLFWLVSGGSFLSQVLGSRGTPGAFFALGWISLVVAQLLGSLLARAGMWATKH